MIRSYYIELKTDFLILIFLHTLTVPSIPLQIPSRKRDVTATQKLVLKPNNVLKMTLP